KHRQSGASSITPYYSLSCGGHQLSMLTQQCAVGTEIEHSAIEGSEFALDNTDYNERIRLLGTMPDSLRFRARNSNRTREVASKIVPSFLGTNSHHDAKPIAFWVTAYKRFRKQYEFTAFRAGLFNPALNQFQRRGSIKGYAS